MLRVTSEFRDVSNVSDADCADRLILELAIHGAFCDGTSRYGVPENLTTG